MSASAPSPGASSPAFVWIVGLGLILGSCGDWALEMERDGRPEFFLVGLGSFLLSHVAYIVAFVVDSRPGWMCTGSFFGAAVVFSGVAGALLSVLLPSVEPKLVAPVIVYGAAIGAMGVTSAAWRPPAAGWGGPLALLGALFFVASDGVLAYNKFVTPVPSGRLIVMTTYYAAQTLLSLAARERWAAAGSKAGAKRD